MQETMQKVVLRVSTGWLVASRSRFWPLVVPSGFHLLVELRAQCIRSPKAIMEVVTLDAVSADDQWHPLLLVCEVCAVS